MILSVPRALLRATYPKREGGREWQCGVFVWLRLNEEIIRCNQLLRERETEMAAMTGGGEHLCGCGLMRK